MLIQFLKIKLSKDRQRTKVFMNKLLLLLFLPLLVLTSCEDDDTPALPMPTGTEKVYTLGSVANPDISGTAKFIENDDNSVTIELALNGTPAGGMHPAHIHLNTAAEGGAIALTLGTVDGGSGKSSVTTTKLDDGTPITYQTLENFDGYINVHLSSSDLGTLVAQGDIGQNELTAETKQYALGSVAVPNISGTATFTKRVNGEALATIQLQNTPADGSHPGHIHLNTAAEGGAIAFTFKPVNGATGMSKTNVAKLDDGTPFLYDNVKGFDGYINIHLSADNLATLVAQGDIGQNELTTTSKVYNLGSVAVPNISGTATFTKRVNGEALATIQLQNTPADGSHPGHIHLNTAAEGGGIAFTFKPVNGATGTSKTNVAALDNGTAIGYDDILDFDGYINVHLAANNLGTLVAQGDIGQNELSLTDAKTYRLGSVAVPGISGTATFVKRKNGEALATIQLQNTPAGGSHPGHIHINTAAEGGAIAFTFKPVNGTTGISKTNVAALDNGTVFGYDAVLGFDGYINIHLSADNLATLVAQGDIGQNELTGDTKSYVLGTKDVAGISGTAKFDKRLNGESLVTLTLAGTPNGGSHPAHIHMNSAAVGGPIVISLSSVNGTTGMSKTNVAKFNDDAAVTFDQLLAYSGYINVHLSASQLATIVAQGNVGSNAN
jgi:hypothetical protein